MSSSVVFGGRRRPSGIGRKQKSTVGASVSAIAAEPTHEHDCRMTERGRGCMKTFEDRVFMGSQTIAESLIVDPGAIWEVDFHATGTARAFSHSLGPLRSPDRLQSGRSGRTVELGLTSRPVC